MKLTELHMSRDELLRLAVKMNHGLAPANIDIEPALGRAFMPMLDPNCTQEELLAWGAKFKEVVGGKIAAMTEKMRAAGEL